MVGLKIQYESNGLSKERLHDPEFIRQFEDMVIQDLNYIQNFVSVAPDARIAPDYSDAKVVKAITDSVYPQVFAFLFKHLDRAHAIQKLREMGRRSATIFLTMVNPNQLKRKAKFNQVIREIGKHSGETYKFQNFIKKGGQLQSCTFRKYHCIFCNELVELEDVGVHYCYPSASFHQHYYNLRSLSSGGFKPRLIYIDIDKTAEHAKDYCQYHVEVLD
ncbi:MAG: hypothetical protein ACTSRS_11175 [Candidatus Helarchaeota archaeon]